VAYSALTFAAAFAAVSCAQQVNIDEDGKAFDQAAYCEAMNTSAEMIDVEAMGDGDAEAYDRAGETYERLAGLAPDELAYEWRVIISGMDAMIREANGEEAATDEEATEFRNAYQTVYSDYTEHCAQ
jgi:hypothetical protein